MTTTPETASTPENLKENKNLPKHTKLTKNLGNSINNPLLLDDQSAYESINCIMREEDQMEEILHYPSRNTAKVLVTKNDLIRLAPDCFLNDTLIDFYSIYLMEKLPLEEKGNYHVFSSFFYKKLTMDLKSGKQKMENLTKRYHLLDRKYLIIPVNDDLHWSLIIICDLKNVLKKKMENKVGGNTTISNSGQNFTLVLHLDSFRGIHNVNRISNNIAEYFTELIKSKLNSENRFDPNFKLNKNNFRLKEVGLPQQSNFCDCGLYLLKYVELFVKNIQNKKASFNLQSLIFRNFEVRELREKMYDLIYHLSGRKNFENYEKIKLKYRNYFNENSIEIIPQHFRKKTIHHKRPPKNETKVKVNIKEIKTLYSIRDVILIDKNQKKNPIDIDFRYNIVVGKNSETRFSLFVTYPQALKIGIKYDIKLFFQKKRWRCQKCGDLNSFYKTKCNNCLFRKKDLKDLIEYMKKTNSFTLKKAINDFYGKNETENPVTLEKKRKIIEEPLKDQEILHKKIK